MKIVMMSEAEYNDMKKAQRNADYLAMLDKSMSEAESGGVIGKTIGGIGEFIGEYHFYTDCLGAVYRVAAGR